MNHVEAQSKNRSDINESDFNLGWLQPGLCYVCSEAVSGLKKGRMYQFEAFSADPLGDTRQYLFRDLAAADFHGVELNADMPTPIWEEHLSAAEAELGV